MTPLGERFTVRTVLVVLVAVVLAFAVALPVVTDVPAGLWVLTAVVMVTVAVGEIWRVGVLDSRDFAPVALAACLAFAMVAALPARLAVEGLPSLVILSTGVATLAGNVARGRLTGEPVPWSDLGLRVVVVTVAVLLFRVLPVGGQTLLGRVAGWQDRRWLVAAVMLAVAAVAIAVQVTVMSARRAVRDHASLWQAMVDEVGAVGPLVLATMSTAAVVALAIRALGPVAVPLFMAPLVLLQLAVGRQSAVRVAGRQTIFALSRLTEQSGFTPHGHAARVARLAVPMGREMGLTERELVDLEYAALLHDLGQVSLRRPIPGGATIATAPLDQRKIAERGASILSRTAELSRLARVVSQQAVPYRTLGEVGEVPLQARILRVANAFDDLVGAEISAAAAQGALERLRLGVDYEYDPTVMRSLCRVLQRDGRLSASAVQHLDV